MNQTLKGKLFQKKLRNHLRIWSKCYIFLRPFFFVFIPESGVEPLSKFSKIPLSREGGALAKYLEEIGEHHPLPSEQEIELAKRIREGDQKARDKLVQANLRFVVSVAKEYQNQGMPLGDLINEGNVGLIKAAERFDGAKGFKFISYAVWWIRQAILKALAATEERRMVPLNRVGALYKISKASARLEQKMEKTPNAEDIARTLDMSPKEVAKTLSSGRRHRSLDAPLGKNDDDGSLFDLIHDESHTSPEEDVIDDSLREQIATVLSSLGEREAQIIRLYYGIGREEALTLDEIGERYGLTRERIRQIKEKALRRLRHISRSRRLRPYLE
ncbi:MAG: RNA polymerase sigma factor RpoD/SigA [Candidatus Latescibacteria bacterium]|nr:RNA polymerase sigma factor RpoD/SigA [Candidatus Latescibacterota bacterium]